MLQEYLPYIMMAYLFTGYVAAFGIYYNELRHGKHWDLLSTGILVLGITVLWAVLVVVMIYASGICGVYGLLHKSTTK